MSVLNDMTKGIMQTKATKASKLTPVAGESAMSVEQAAAALGIPEIPQVFLTNEAVRDVAADLRRQAALLVAVADGLDALTSLSTVPAETKQQAAEVKKQVEAEADARVAAATPDDGAEEFSDRMKRLSAEAQAAVYSAADDDGTATEPVAPLPTVDGWNCPDHGATDLIDTKSRAGRAYRLCGVADCEQYEN